MSHEVRTDIAVLHRTEPAKEPSKHFVDYVSKRSGQRILDLGSGNGSYSQELARMGFQCVSADISLGYLSEAKRRGVDVVQTDACNLAFRDKSFDTIIMLEVLEHLNDPDKAVEECARVAMENVLVTTPNHDSYFWLKQHDLYLESCIPSDHVNFFTKRSLEELLRKHFMHVQLKYGEPVRIFPDTKPICFHRLYAEARFSESDKLEMLHIDETQQLKDYYSEPESILDFLYLEIPRSLEVTETCLGALNALLRIYYLRPDLQAAFPEVKNGDYRNLLQWATRVISGEGKDSSSEYLILYDLLLLPVKIDKLRQDGLKDQLDSLRTSIQQKCSEISALKVSLEEKTRELHEISESVGWRVVQNYRRFLTRHALPGTSRRKTIELLTRALLGALERRGQRSPLEPFRQLACLHPRFTVRDDHYKVWLENNDVTPAVTLRIRKEIDQFSYKPKISIVMPVYDTDEKWLRLALESVVSQIYPKWELCIADDASTKEHVKRLLKDYSAKDRRIIVKFLDKNEGIAGASNQALSLATGEFVGFLDHDDELSIDALFHVVRVLNQRPDADFIYSDEDKKDQNGNRIEPFFKPDWSPDLLLSINYVPHFCIYRKSLLDSIGGLREGFEGAQDYDLVLRVTERNKKIAHISRPLYSWRKIPESAALSLAAKPMARQSAKRAIQEALKRRGIRAEVLDGFNFWYRIKYILTGNPLVSIIVITHDNYRLLRRCLESIERKTKYRNYELIIIAHRCQETETLGYLESLPYKILKYDGKFNFSKINNYAASNARGDYLLFLNDDTEVIELEWLTEMLSIAHSRPEVGAVGAKLLFRDGRIQHAGVIVGVGGAAVNAFQRMQNSEPGYFGFAHVIRNCSAVTAACMLVKKDLFEKLGGFDEKLALGGNDVDLCLRMLERGYLVVYTPYAILYHEEGATRKGGFPLSDYNYFTSKWREFMRNGDPYYNLNLSLRSEDSLFTLET